MNTKFLLLATTGTGLLGGVAGVGYWYSQPKNLRELLLKEQIKLLDTESDKHDTQWKELAKKHKADANGRTKDNKEIKQIKDLNITGENDSIKFSELKAKCKSLLETPIADSEEFKEIKNSVINWCSEKSPFSKATPAIGG
ncbi:hypothetical protein A6V39_00410 [Candidatus Mycoplasma haematobovis]|uniref:Uncharacterized protein n=1 Tax=Candidatus Mycoplasma haematobovis TaxID=432608 RepID=A0A1A9QD48_9MOLU|nr:hypothetical protein [Candidatus Mycoplasma haematobovis]OAL10512.1 hypothetical protein A6V39_00410 [Candidatus Mycoplasma haematobovis]